MILHELILQLGSNQGDRVDYLARARAAIAERIGPLQRASAIYESAAWGVHDQPAFLNQMLLVSTPLKAREVLQAIQAIEQSLGRERRQRWAARTLDIDILFYDDLVLDEPGLTIPHPRLHERRFVLLPLAELAPDWQHPQLKRSVRQLLDDCPDKLAVYPYKNQ